MIEECINYIEFNLTEELNLDILARRFSINPTSLSKKFKSELGETLTEYINQKRVTASLPLLAATRLPIGEVAEKVGYLNENYYSRIFKKIQGMTTREYRNTMLEPEFSQIVRMVWSVCRRRLQAYSKRVSFRYWLKFI